MRSILRSTRYLGRIIQKTDYWYNWDSLLESAKEFRAMLAENRGYILKNGKLPSVPGRNLLFFQENMGFHFPYGFLKSSEAFSQMLSPHQLEVIDAAASSEDLYSALFDFKLEALDAVLACLESGTPPSALRELALTFLRRIAAYPETLDVLHTEVELLATDAASALYEQVGNPWLLCDPPSVLAGELFLAPDIAMNATPRASFGVCGTVAVLLFLSKELSTREIDSMYSECIEITPEFVYPVFHCIPPKLLESGAEILEEQNRNALTFLAEYGNWKEDTRETILDIIEPEELIELNLPFIIKRRNFDEARNRIKQFSTDNKDLFETGNILYALYNGRGAALRPPVDIERDMNGENWVFRYKKQETLVPMRYKGAGFIAALVKNPGAEIPAYRLQDDISEFGDSLELMIREAGMNEEEAASFVEEIRDLEILIRDSERNGTGLFEEALEMRAELIGGLTERRDAAVEKGMKKAGDAVQKAVRRAIEYVSESAPDLASYLELHIKTGIKLKFVL